MTDATEKKNTALAERPPVVAVMGHIDHGKSTLLDYIRKTNIVEKEAGGITQRISAYEFEHKLPDGRIKKITFLDTPGHEAFRAIRSRGASVADIAILVVSAEDGVKPQTLEALSSIKEAEIPFVVAINKIDKPSASVDRAKQSLAENEIYVEGYGGSIPAVPVSAKTGEGIPELIDIVLLASELEELKGDASLPAEGAVIESGVDPKKGISATLVIKNGSLRSGEYVTAGGSCAPVRIMEDHLGRKIKEATFSAPVRIIGWTEVPPAGSDFKTFDIKYAAESCAAAFAEMEKSARSKKSDAPKPEGIAIVPVIIKADAAGSIDAIKHELAKLQNERIAPEIIYAGIGAITENDVKMAGVGMSAIILGFNVKTDERASGLAERNGVEIKTFDIIYKLAEWLEEAMKQRTPKITVEETVGRAKILKIFGGTKDKTIAGGRVESGLIARGESINVLRRGEKIGSGKIRGLQQNKAEADEVTEGKEFGSMIQSNVELAPGDHIECFKLVEK